MMYAENQLLPISALQHLIFCERQCALIHVEQLWSENVLTIEGRQLHQKAHDGNREVLADKRITRGLWLTSHQKGLIGQADVVEFLNDGRVLPVEYKRGKPKKDFSDQVQICAQAMCLEEMLDVNIETGELFYGTRKRRTEVVFDKTLRARTDETIVKLHQMIQSRTTPTARRTPKCDKCSLLELCMPDSQRLSTGAEAFNKRSFSAAAAMPVPVSDDTEHFFPEAD